MAGTVSLAKRRRALQRASAALDGLDGELWAAPEAELGPLMELVDGLAARAAAGRVAVLAEAVVAVVDACRQARYARLREAVLGARVPVGNAACLVAEFERLAHRLNPSVHEPALDYLLVAAQTGTAGTCAPCARRWWPGSAGTGSSRPTRTGGGSGPACQPR